MEITREQRAAWAIRKENIEFEAVVGPQYKNADGTADLDRLYALAELNGLLNLRNRYKGNTGQIAMNVRNRLRSLWQRGTLKLVYLAL